MIVGFEIAISTSKWLYSIDPSEIKIKFRMAGIVWVGEREGELLPKVFYPSGS